MKTCEHCQTRLLDYVYDLLEEKENQQIREHLHGCPQCQSALEKERGEQQVLARAAKAMVGVPEFKLPAPELPPTIPMTPLPPKQRPSFRRVARLGWSVAAAVLIAVTAAFAYHRHTLGKLQNELAERQGQAANVSAELAALPAKYQRLRRAALDDTLAQSGGYLHVAGPKVLQAGAKAHLDIVSREIEGKPAAANLVAKLVEPKSGHAVKVWRTPTDEAGRAHVEIDAGAATANHDLKLVVEADAGGTGARIEETIRVEAPAFVTRLDTNKLAYQFKDVLFFRVLALERYRLTPPSRPIVMRVELAAPGGQIVRSLDLPTGPGGILASEFAIDEQLPAGSYTLRVRAADAQRADVQATARRLEVVRELLVPDIQFDQERYLPGDRVTGTYRGAAPPSRALVGKQPVPLMMQPQTGGFGGAPGGGGFAKKADAKKDPLAARAPMRFEVPLPADLPAGPSTITLQLGDRAQKREVQATIPIAPTEFAVDLFPEGGDLIAGVKNRVFYRVRSKSGEPVTGDGSLILLSKKEIVDSAYQLGMGFFDFVPEAAETYSVRVTTPVKTENLANPFAKLGIRGDGVVVHVPTAVGAQGDPIRVTIRQHGPPRKLLVAAQCRGQLLDQRWVEVDKDSANLILNPTRQAAGMIRVTAYELASGPGPDRVLTPVAERLVYRRAGGRLELGFQLNTHQLHAGRNLVANVMARDEKGQPAPAWMLASVVDERFQARPRSLSAYFLLLNEIQTGPDLDNAQVILHDGPESMPVLERFLGTHGWRRFVRPQAPAAADRADHPQPLVFSRENRPLEVLQKQHQEKLGLAQAPIQQAAESERASLEARRAELAGAVTLATRNLADFEQNTETWIRLAMGLAVAGLFLIAVILTGVGTVRAIVLGRPATASFGGAFACLLLCLGILVANRTAEPRNHVGHAEAQAKAFHKDAAPPVRVGVEWQAPALANAPSRPAVGAFILLEEPSHEELRGQQADLAKKASAAAVNGARSATQAQLEKALVRRSRGGDAYAYSADAQERLDRLTENKALAPRFQQSLQIGKADQSAPTVQPVAPAKGKKKGLTAPSHKKMRDADRNAGVQYAFEHAPNLLSDTLLWHPRLWLADGSAQVRFDLASGNTTYRVLLLGHDANGRFGFFETRLDVVETGR